MKMKIKDIGEIVTGKTPSTKQKEYFNGNINFFTPEDIFQGYIVTCSTRKISELGLKSIGKSALNGISVAVGCIGSDMGNSAIIEGPCATNQQINSITNIKKEINPYYLYYKSTLMKNIYRTKAVSTAQPLLPKSVFEDIEIEIPDLDYQLNCVKLLKSIDEKILNNKKINAELESMAKTIYDYWFLQFEFPNEEGNPYKSSGGKMVWNKELKREIPQGWESKKLSDILEKVNRKYDYSKISKTYDLSIMTSNSISIYGTSSSKYFDTNLFSVKKGDLLFGSIRPYLRKAGIAAYDGAVTGTIHCYEVKNSIDYNFVLFSITSENFFKYAINNSIGTKMPVVSSQDLLNFNIPYNDKIVKLFNKISVKDEVVSNVIQSNELASLRDFLLPFLMNGQVSFK